MPWSKSNELNQHHCASIHQIKFCVSKAYSRFTILWYIDCVKIAHPFYTYRRPYTIYRYMITQCIVTYPRGGEKLRFCQFNYRFGRPHFHFNISRLKCHLRYKCDESSFPVWNEFAFCDRKICYVAVDSPSAYIKKY